MLFSVVLFFFVIVYYSALTFRTLVLAFKVVCIMFVCILATVSMNNESKIEFILYLVFAIGIQISTDIHLYYITRHSRSVLPIQSDDSGDDIQGDLGIGT
jgi:hypothetical protein